MNRKLLALLFFAVFSTSIMADEDSDSDRSVAISVSPLSLIIGSGDVLFQYNILPFLSLTLPVQFAYYWPLSKGISWINENKTALAVTKAPIAFETGLGARFYPTAKGMTDGFYLEPRVTVAYGRFGAETSEWGEFYWTRVSVLSKLKFGWDWFWDSGFYTNLGAGVGVSYDAKQELKLPPKLLSKFKNYGYVFSYVPTEAKTRFVWDLEWKIGFAF